MEKRVEMILGDVISGKEIDLLNPDDVKFWSGTNNKTNTISLEKPLRYVITNSGTYSGTADLFYVALIDIKNEKVYRIGRGSAGNLNGEVDFSTYVTAVSDNSITLRGGYGGTGTSYYAAALYY